VRWCARCRAHGNGGTRERSSITMMGRPRPPEQREPSNHASERDRRGSAVICGEARVTEKADDQCDGARCAVPMAPKRHCTWRRVREITDHHDGETDALTSAPHLAAHEQTRDATTERPRHPRRRAPSDHASRRDQRGSQRGARRIRRPGGSTLERLARGTWRSPAHRTWRRTREHGNVVEGQMHLGRQEPSDRTSERDQREPASISGIRPRERAHGQARDVEWSFARSAPR
jgi:hypothetical protein